jgi:sugar lactone lactonase YvrE
MKRVIFWVIMGITVIGIIGCGAPTVSVTGLVTRKDTGALLDGVTINAVDADQQVVVSTTTDTDGAYALSGVPVGAQLTASKGSWWFQPAAVSVESTTEKVDFQANAAQYEFVRKWGEEGSGNGEFDSPTGITVGPGIKDMSSGDHVYVADTANQRIQVFSTDGVFLDKWGAGGAASAPEAMDYPSNVAVPVADEVWVTDAGHNRIQKWEIPPSSYTVTIYGQIGQALGEFVTPPDIFIDGASVYVADQGNNRVQILQYSDGSADSQWTVGSDVNMIGGMDSDGNMYVTDKAENKAHKCTPSSGTRLLSFGGTGSNTGELYFPEDIVIDDQNFVLVVDRLNYRIQKFNTSGDFVTAFGSYGTGTGQFINPVSIAVDSAGAIYVVDSYRDCVQKFSRIQ